MSKSRGEQNNIDRRDRGESRVGVRLRVRHLCRRTHAEMSEVLAQLVSVHGATRYLRSEKGPEFVATPILGWLQTAQIENRVHRSRQAMAERCG